MEIQFSNNRENQSSKITYQEVKELVKREYFLLLNLHFSEDKYSTQNNLGGIKLPEPKLMIIIFKWINK